jgi:predicted enzyme related to lactoylglutathione lyase
MNEFNRKNNLGVWFDIPVADLDRASTFYAKTLGIQVSKQNFNDVEFSVLEHDNGNGGCLIPRAEEVAPESGIWFTLMCMADSMMRWTRLKLMEVKSCFPFTPLDRMVSGQSF